MSTIMTFNAGYERFVKLQKLSRDTKRSVSAIIRDAVDNMLADIDAESKNSVNEKAMEEGVTSTTAGTTESSDPSSNQNIHASNINNCEALDNAREPS